MILGKKLVVVMPAYNAAETLERTWQEIPHEVVDDVILVDDFSSDGTVALAKKLGIKHVVEHSENLGYGGNQKSCYRKALDLGAKIVVMLHPDYQYTPKLIYPMALLIAQGVYPVVLGSRILGGGALSGGMPFYKYFANRALTFFENLFLGLKLSEYHTGYRAFESEILQSIKLENNSNDFIFDNQVLSQIAMAGYPIGEITCPTRYFPEASSINFAKSIVYGFGVIKTTLVHFCHKRGICRSKLY